jgi:glycosyltransferase involved in cell wall biosynthesis
LVAGEEKKEDLRNRVDELGVSSSVQVLGRIPHEKMPDLLGDADIYVSTSTTDGTSVSLLEAMASGAFPVVTDISANENGSRTVKVAWSRRGMKLFLQERS